MTYGIRRLMCIQGCGDMARSATVGEVELGSAGEDDFLEVQSPPTDSSEDSVEVKVAPISSRNKRKCAEPRRVPDTFTGPLKKRMCLKVKAEVADAHPFRPWSPKPAPSPPPPLPPPSLSAALPEKVGDVTVKCLPYPEQLCPVRASSFAVPQVPLPYRPPPCLQLGGYFRPPSPLPAEEQPVALVKRSEPSPPPQPALVQVKEESAESDDRLLLGTFSGLQGVSRREQRNYKNMTRERRIEANARERTRVHTISAAFDTLRRSVPAYSHNQKLSKLSVLRIACSYIKTLADIAEGRDDQATADSVDTVSRTIQREGKLRKKKDDND